MVWYRWTRLKLRRNCCKTLSETAASRLGATRQTRATVRASSIRSTTRTTRATSWAALSEATPECGSSPAIAATRPSARTTTSGPIIGRRQRACTATLDTRAVWSASRSCHITKTAAPSTTRARQGRGSSAQSAFPAARGRASASSRKTAPFILSATGAPASSATRVALCEATSRRRTSGQSCCCRATSTSIRTRSPAPPQARCTANSTFSSASCPCACDSRASTRPLRSSASPSTTSPLQSYRRGGGNQRTRMPWTGASRKERWAHRSARIGMAPRSNSTCRLGRPTAKSAAGSAFRRPSVSSRGPRTAAPPSRASWSPATAQLRRSSTRPSPSSAAPARRRRRSRSAWSSRRSKSNCVSFTSRTESTTRSRSVTQTAASCPCAPAQRSICRTSSRRLLRQRRTGARGGA
mmetsp:Transcript_13691/g.48613  ORF Transcript_13691/g.48613 Transcript_13691/m.48613 type:complete len:411 (+) Transcript_13691:234-1466(+)